MTVFFSGGFGNLLTLVAIPYMRQKYGSQFSILQLNSVVLILHLSLADLLFAIPSIPHRSGKTKVGGTAWNGVASLIMQNDFNLLCRFLFIARSLD